MRNTFDNRIHPACEEDLVYPDESSEFMTADECGEQMQSELEQLLDKKEKFAQRKHTKSL